MVTRTQIRPSKVEVDEDALEQLQEIHDYFPRYVIYGRAMEFAVENREEFTQFLED